MLFPKTPSRTRGWVTQHVLFHIQYLILALIKLCTPAPEFRALLGSGTIPAGGDPTAVLLRWVLELKKKKRS